MIEVASKVIPYVLAVEEQLTAGQISPPIQLEDDQEFDLGLQPVKIVDMQVDNNRKDSLYLGLVQAGRAFGQRCYIRSDLRGVKFNSLKSKLGFSYRYLEKTSYRTFVPREAVGMLAWATCRHAPTWRKDFKDKIVTIGANVVQVGDVFMASNRKLMKTRREPCPLELKLPCYACERGLDTCPRAVRPVQIAR